MRKTKQWRRDAVQAESDPTDQFKPRYHSSNLNKKMAGNYRHAIASRIYARRNARRTQPPPPRRRTAAFEHVAAAGRESSALLPSPACKFHADAHRRPESPAGAATCGVPRRWQRGRSRPAALSRGCDRQVGRGWGEGDRRHPLLLRRSAHGPALRRGSPLDRTGRRLCCAAACRTPSLLTTPCRALLLQPPSSDGRRRRGHG